MNYIQKFFGHLKTILIHKYWVCYYCYHAGILWQGIIHDLSKFSPIEFFEGVKYYTGSSSPIDACKKENGYSAAWMHHNGRNKHHYEYWQDNFDNGGEPIMMPFRYATEMICDYLGAARAYCGEDFNLEDEYEWWLKKRCKPLAMHRQTQFFIELVMLKLKDCKYGSEVVVLDKDNLRKLFIKAVRMNDTIPYHEELKDDN
jgi:hypothetical protein